MSTSITSSNQHAPKRSESLWPLDVAIASLSGLVLYLVANKLTFDDPRWLYNAWTYVISIPLATLLLSLGSRVFVSRFIRKSLQFGFIFSVFIHLLLLILAVNVVIFNNYFPDALTGVKRERRPLRQTIPEYVFNTPREKSPTPDWSKPVDAETASRVVPTEKRQLPAVDVAAAKLEIPKPPDNESRPIQKSLLKRDVPSESMPVPAESPGRLATPRDVRFSQSASWSPTQPAVSSVPAKRFVQDERLEQPELSAIQRKQETEPTLAPEIEPDDAITAQDDSPPPIAKIERLSPQIKPEVAATPTRRPKSQNLRRRQLAAGARPQAAGVKLDRSQNASDRISENIEAVPAKRSETSGASLAMNERVDASLAGDDTFAIAAVVPQRVQRDPLLLKPVAPTSLPQARSKSTTNLGSSRQRFQPAGTAPSTARSVPAKGAKPSSADQITDRLDDSVVPRRSSSVSKVKPMSDLEQTGPSMDLLIDNGPIGLADKIDRSVGIIPGESIPEVSALELRPGNRRRQLLGGPVTPAGNKVAATESFSRRVKRTTGGAAPTPIGAVGQATEKAIEQGLAYLASIQNQDGSWSLQGHGSEVVLRSDTAATGLCLLAFQGAGYTHREHQYADTISRGLKFLLDSQATNGNLYRLENTISNQNVALYSHGIAALALCEAYGMTQDPELRAAAQNCIGYMVQTQHRRRGGWRYTPQVSSDTSVTGWMMMALKSGELAGLEVPAESYDGIKRWLRFAQGENRNDRYRYNPFAPDTPTQRHGRVPTPTMTAVGVLMRLYMGWNRELPSMQSAADYLMDYPPQMGTSRSPQRDAYYWYYATMVMFHMGGDHWKAWNSYLKPLLLDSQVSEGELAGSWDPIDPVPDRWSPHAGRIYVTTMNLLNLEVYYRHLPIYDDSAQ